MKYAVLALLVASCSIDREGTLTAGDGGSMGLDGGGGGIDAPGIDAPGIDAPGIDAPTCTPTGDPVDDCDGVDDDCDSSIDEDCPCTAGDMRPCGTCGDGVEVCVGTGWGPCTGATLPVVYHEDADGDTFGAGAAMTSCTPLAGWVTNDADCDDACVTCHPGGAETCDGRDNDCNGATDDGVGTTYYRDADGDGFGNPGESMLLCTAPGAGWTTTSTDCDDTCARCHPGFPHELCGDGADNDCDGATDEAGCPCDIFTASGGTYAYCRGAYTWAAGRTRCGEIGGDLASFERRAENDAVWAVVDPYDTWVWIGGSDMTEGSYRWVSGAVICGGAGAPACGSCAECAWYPGQPNGGGDDCVIWRVDWGGRWGDYGCGNTAAAVCELP